MCSDHVRFVVRSGRGGSLSAFVHLFRHAPPGAMWIWRPWHIILWRIEFDDDIVLWPMRVYRAYNDFKFKLLLNSAKPTCIISFRVGPPFPFPPSCAFEIASFRAYFSAVMDERATPITWNGVTVSFTFSWKTSSPTFASSTMLSSAAPPTTPTAHVQIRKHQKTGMA